MSDMSKPLFVRDDIFEVSTITMDKRDLKKAHSKHSMNHGINTFRM